MPDLELTRRQYADQIRDALWRRCHVRLSDELCSAFAQVPRERAPRWRDLAAAGRMTRGAATG
jgi:hypothetical protein